MLIGAVVVGTQHQLLPVPEDELGKVDGLIAVPGLGLMNYAGPRDEVLNRSPLRRRETGGDFLVGQQIEDRLLLRQLGSKTVDHAHSAILISAQQRMRQIEARQEFLYFDPPED